MSGRSRTLVLLVSTPLAAFVIVGGLIGAARRAAPPDTPLYLLPFKDVVTHIIDDYVDNVNPDKVFDGAMRGLVDDLDGSSAYLTPDEVKAADANTALGPADVGLVVTHQFWLHVIGVRDGSPAARAKIESGDFIRMIDKQPTRDMSAYAATRLLHGAPGSKVTVLVLRGSTTDPTSFDLVREVAPATEVSAKRLPGGEAYLRIASFRDAADAVRASVASLGQAAAPGLIIDIRDTADGTAEDGVAIARLFVKSGTLSTRVGRAPSDKTTTTAAPGDGALTMPTVLVVSDGTGNAAEVFAAALQGNQRARLVGQPTAGLASEQQLVHLPDGHGLWLTYRQYMQNDGTPILEHGLKPDVFVDVPVIGFDEAPIPGDPTLDHAVSELKRVEQAGAAPASANPPRGVDVPAR